MSEYTINPYGVTDEVPAGVSVYNGLDSNSTYMALSAYQGKRLKEMIDSKADGDLVITRFAVNLCDSSKMTSGTLGSNGAVASGSGLVTDFIPIIVGAGTNNWEKTQYLQVCASVFKTNAFGYRAEKVCTYNSSKTYIGAISSVSAIIDKESQANASNFTNAAYIRVQFASGTSDHYVSLSNKPVLPQYSPYDKQSLSASVSFLPPKIHNTDGAITNMLETALDYLNNVKYKSSGNLSYGLELGYGDSATAFDETVDAVAPDSWDTSPNYSGTKKQINCSTFVMLSLCGVRYANSRYALGSSVDNHGNGYVFDDKTETNYHNALGTIPCSSHNKLYANKMLKYTLDRGFAYLIEDGFKNVEVGDVIFSSNSSGTYKDVGHVLFVSSVNLKDDGTKVISIMEDGHDGVVESQKTSRPSQYVYAARFPLPHLTSKAANIVSSISREASFSSLSSGTTKKIGTLTLSENVKPQGVYTAVVECSGAGDYEVMVGTYSGSTFTALGTNGQNLFRRGDGVTVKHFHLPVNSSVNTDTIAVAIKSYSALNNNVEIVDAKMYNGFVTE